MSWAAFGGAALLAWMSGGAFGRLLLSRGLSRTNYRGRMIPTGFGVLLLLASLPFYLVALSAPAERGIALRFIAASVSFCLLGLADDLWGDRSVGGFKGHFRRLFREGKLTTGAAKALLGAAVALGLGFSLFAGQPWDAATTGLLIALCANALNLVDTRPVRSAAIFLLTSGGILLFFVATRSGVPAVFGALPGATLGYLPMERSKRGMLGDAGSNLLGGVLGLSLGVALSLSAKLVAVALLVGFHLFTERQSLNAWIQEHPTLSRLDLWLQGPAPEEAKGAG